MAVSFSMLSISSHLNLK